MLVIQKVWVLCTVFFFFLLTWNIRPAEIQPTNSWGRPPSPDSPLLARRVRYPSRLATMGNLTPKNFPSLLRHPTTLARFVSKEIGEYYGQKNSVNTIWFTDLEKMAENDEEGMVY